MKEKKSASEKDKLAENETDSIREGKHDKAFRETEATLRTIFYKAPVGIGVVRKRIIQQVNDHICNLLGYTETELVGKNSRILYPSDEDYEFVGREKYRQIQKFGSGTVETIWKQKDGRIIHILLSSTLINPANPSGDVMFTAFDITKRKRTENALIESEARFRRMAENAKDMIYRMSLPGGIYEYVSPASSEIFGYLPEEFYKSPKLIAQVIHPRWRDFFKEQWEKLLAGQMPPVYEYEIVHKSGEERWVYQRNVLLRNKKGRPVAIEGLVTDITDRKRAENALKESRDILKNILEASPIGIGYTENRVMKWISTAMVQIFGYDHEEEILNRQVRIAYPSESEYQRVNNILKEQLTVEETADINAVFRRKDGSTFHGNLKVSTLNPKDPMKGLIYAVSDLSWQERAEEERIRLETAIEQAAESVVITDKDGIIQYVNPAFSRVTGYGREEILGENPRILKSGQHDPSFYQEMWTTLNNGQVWTGHFVNKRKNGTIYEEEGSISPIRDSSGAVTNYVAVKRDVTDELKMERQLLQAQKMEAIGTLAGGIAHDFNNILGAILGYTELAQLHIETGSKARSNLSQVLKAANRAKDLVKQILAFSRQTEQEERPVLLTPLLKEALKMLRASIPTTIEIRQHIRGEPGAVMADPTEIHQVLMNLCTNAAHAMLEKGGVLEVTLQDVDLERHVNDELGELESGPYVKLTVKDTGQGIDPAVKVRIFEPYFTTKPQDVGTGLGLAVVHGIATGCGGGVLVDTEMGKGSTFQIFFPRLETVVSEETELEALPAHGNERVLFVDDEEMLVMLAKEMLERLGYEVVTKRSPLKALQAFQADPERFDVVITDQTMPGMTGDLLAKELMALRPDIPIILCTGFSELMHEEKAKKLGIREFVMKPLVLRELASAVRRALGESEK